VALDRRRLISIVAGAAAVGGLIWLQRLDQTPQFVTVPTDAPGPPLPSPFLTAQLFHPGTRLRLDLGETAVAATEDAGVLDLPTGQLIAVDPSWLYRGPTPYRSRCRLRRATIRSPWAWRWALAPPAPLSPRQN
jgi:hypothetical protein